MLERGLGHLHAPGAAHGRMRHIAVAANLVGGVDDDHALLLGQDASGLAQQSGLAHAGPAQQQQALAAVDDVLDDVASAIHGAAHAAGEAHHLAAPVADAADAVERALHAGAVVGVKVADAGDGVVQVSAGDFVIREHHLAIEVARGGHTPQIQDHFE